MSSVLKMSILPFVECSRIFMLLMLQSFLHDFIVKKDNVNDRNNVFDILVARVLINGITLH